MTVRSDTKTSPALPVPALQDTTGVAVGPCRNRYAAQLPPANMSCTSEHMHSSDHDYAANPAGRLTRCMRLSTAAALTLHAIADLRGECKGASIDASRSGALVLWAADPQAIRPLLVEASLSADLPLLACTFTGQVKHDLLQAEVVCSPGTNIAWEAGVCLATGRHQVQHSTSQELSATRTNYAEAKNLLASCSQKGRSLRSS